MMAAKRIPWLHVIAGCMSSGKTAEVVRLLTRRQIAGQSVLLITPARDTRVAPGEVVSRTGTRFPSVVAADTAGILAEVARRDPDAVAIEEAQFFGPDLPEVLEQILATPRTVIVSGLDQDFAGRDRNGFDRGGGARYPHQLHRLPPKPKPLTQLARTVVIAF